MKKLLLYTFYNLNGLTYKLVRSLNFRNIEKFYVRGLEGAEKLVSHVVKNQHDFILGLGDYRKDAKRIRVEERFINKYGKSKIVEDGPSYYLAGWDLPLGEGMYVSNKPTNGPCNRSAYLLAHAIAQNNLDTKLAFVHVPRGLEGNLIQRAVSNWVAGVG